ncbi:EamA family transporter [Catellatospora tritici]|uniref:EamA family transporter n=1 Tax=Catellatospora tritici TaxID=2851566 RepID=UPI001C2CCF3E|nr:EamA family transporter [Catellatospora tritici]MBV1849423.1 EamA family transporter [Catellatospora tritici]
MHTQRPTGLGLGLAVISAATFATSGSFAHSLMDAGWSATAAVAARIGVAALVLVVPTIIALRGRWHVLGRSAGPVALYGLLAVGGAQVGFFNAVRYLPVGVALLLEYLGIILVVFWMWAAHGQRPGRLTIAGAVAAVIGLLLILDLTGGRFELVGLVWGLVAAVGLAVYFVLSARVDSQLPSVAMASGGMALGAVMLVALGAAGLLPLHATFGDVEFAGHRVSWLVPLLGLSLVAAVVSYLCGIGAARILGARMSSFVGLTEVLFAVLIAWLVLDELPTRLQLLGGVLILVGVVLVRLDEARHESAQAPSAEPELVGQRA